MRKLKEYLLFQLTIIWINTFTAVSIFAVFMVAIALLPALLFYPLTNGTITDYLLLPNYSVVYWQSALTLILIKFCDFKAFTEEHRDVAKFRNIVHADRIQYILSGKADNIIVNNKAELKNYPCEQSFKIQWSFIKHFISRKSWIKRDYSIKSDCEDGDFEYKLEYKNHDIKTYEEVLRELFLIEQSFIPIFEKTYDIKFTKKIRERFPIVYHVHKEEITPYFRREALLDKLPPKKTKQKVNKI